MDDQRDAFGYQRDDDVRTLNSIYVGEAKTHDTLEPTVVLYVTWLEPDHTKHRLGLAMSPEFADQIAPFLHNELRRWAQRARDKHYQ